MNEEIKAKISTAMKKYWNGNDYSIERFNEKEVIEFIGKKFGRLTVRALLPIRKGRGRTWSCTCECGGRKEIRTYSLTSGEVKSCGCLHDDRAKKYLPPGESGARHLYRNYKDSARRRKIKFSLPYEEFKNLTSKNCVYCGSPPSFISKSYNAKNSYSFYHYNGLDRVNPSVGYISDNVEPCCTICNIMKWTLTRENFLRHIEKILRFQQNKTD
jgi:hypothetical protein